ncbi:hypothetical protein EZS27_011833 [termite gut metagenome]|uniref:Uncharacterized protein n=1 Tax=termite gut metagenome TaxID=433724 RepID=A0A5J4S4M4_9ZZZZ
MENLALFIHFLPYFWGRVRYVLLLRYTLSTCAVLLSVCFVPDAVGQARESPFLYKTYLGIVTDIHFYFSDMEKRGMYSQRAKCGIILYHKILLTFFSCAVNRC